MRWEWSASPAQGGSRTGSTSVEGMRRDGFSTVRRIGMDDIPALGSPGARSGGLLLCRVVPVDKQRRARPDSSRSPNQIRPAKKVPSENFP